MQYNLNDMSSMDRFYRANLVNSLSGFKPVSLIGTTNKEAVLNLAVFSNIVHLGADPALVGFVNRPREAAPHTLSNIEATGWYTINQISSQFVQQAHQSSAKYKVDESEFDAIGLTPEWKDGIPAPYVLQSAVKYAVKLKEVIPIKWNDTFFVIGSIEQIIVPENLIESDGFLSLEKADVICSLGIDGYYSTKRIARYAYAKPGKQAEEIR